ncbi:MAG: hypothetical protein ABL862_09435 [Candidatus Nitrotoga sp.]
MTTRILLDILHHAWQLMARCCPSPSNTNRQKADIHNAATIFMVAAASAIFFCCRLLP